MPAAALLRSNKRNTQNRDRSRCQSKVFWYWVSKIFEQTVFPPIFCQSYRLPRSRGWRAITGDHATDTVEFSMDPNRKTLVVPVLLIALGTGWLLTAAGVAPGVSWVWILGLAAVGVMTLVAGGIDKLTIVVGPLFILASVLSMLRQTGRLHIDFEVPILVIAAGVLLLVARSPALPMPDYVVARPRPAKKSRRSKSAGTS